MNHRICDECETVMHCTKHGCIPKQPARQQKSSHLDPADVSFLPDALASQMNAAVSHLDAAKPAQPSKPWVGLTEDERRDAFLKSIGNDSYAKLVEAKLKEKNT